MKTILRFIVAYCLAYTLGVISFYVADKAVNLLAGIDADIFTFTFLVSILYVSCLIYDKIVK